MAPDISKLNKAQKKAVTFGTGPIMIVAGAGTGKTTVITNRIAWLIAEGMAKPNEILGVTFTEKAAGEMEERVDRLLPLGYTDLWIHTFHGFCHRVLEAHGFDIGLSADFKVLDQTAAWLLVRKNLERFELEYYRPLGNPTKFIHALLGHFGRCKDEGVHASDYLSYAENLKLNSDQTGDREAVGTEIARVTEIANAYHVYQTLLLEHGALDFGDLIDYTFQLFKKREKILRQYRERFKYILVDEFQDTNWLQYELIKTLALPRNNIMVVGDDDQSIYKFRGASFSNILTFKKDFPDAQEIFLTENYRSKQNILDVAYKFIQLNNPDRLEVKLSQGGKKLSKKLVSKVGSAGDITVMRYETGDDEVRGVIEAISDLKNKHADFSWSDIVILVRANDQAQRFVRYFRSLNVPHHFLAAKGLYTQDVIRAVVSYLKLLDNYHESTALYAVLALPFWGIEIQDLINLNHLANKKSWSLWHTLHHYHGNLEISASSNKAFDSLIALVLRHTEQAKKLDPSHLVYRFLEDSGYLEYLTVEDSQYTREQMSYLNQFYKKIRTWEEENLGNGVKDFMQFFDLELESGDVGTLAQDLESGPDEISISTIHAAKGLEFRFVFIIGLVHLRFPSRERKDPIDLPQELIKDMLPEGDAHLEEERRLMYVALTRAKEKVFLTYAQNYGGVTKRKPSQFLAELGVEFNVPLATVQRDLVLTEPASFQEIKTTYKLPSKFSFTQLKTFETCPKQYYYAHIIQIPSAGRGTFTFGKTMHEVLQKFFERVKEVGAQKQGTLFSDASTNITEISKLVSLSELLNMYEKLWNEDWFTDAEEKEKYREKGKGMLEDFYKKISASAPVPVMLEEPFNVKVGAYTIKGRVDRIDEITKGELPGVKIVDYKTGSPPSGDKLTFKDKEQLLIYQIAATEVLQKKVESLTLYFLSNGKEYSFLGSPEELSKIKQWITSTIDKIQVSNFEADPSPFKCRYCDFKYICPAAQL